MGLLLKINFAKKINRYFNSDTLHFIELLRVLVRRNLMVRYRGSFLGIYWSLLNPLILAGLYSAIFGTAFAKYFDNSIINYIFAVVTGLIVANFYAASTSQALTSVVTNGILLNKIRLPVSVFPISIILANIFQFMMGAFPLLVILTLIKSHSLINAFAVIFPFIALVFICVGISFFVSTLFVFFRDLPYFYELLTFGLRITSPIFYPRKIVSPRIQPILDLNPLTPIIDSLRQITLSGDLPDLALVFHAILGGIILTGLGWFFFRHMRSQFMDLL